MKAIKMFGLAALAALMAMAFVGAGTAMAEPGQLCGHDGHPCEAIHHIHEVSDGKAKLLTSIGTTECNVLFLGDVTAFGKPIKIKGVLTKEEETIENSFTYSNCELGGSGCTATEENGPAELEVLKEGHETGSVTGKGLVHLKCGSTIDCSYNGTGLKGTIKGPLLSAELNPNGEVSLSGQETTKEAGGFLCPKTAKLDITTSPLWPVYISEELLGYCVKTEHTVGIYTNETCTTLGNPKAKETQEHKWTYALVFAPEGQEKGKFLCYGTLLKYGLYEAKHTINECEKDIPAGEPQIGLYERGEIKTVE